MAPITVLVPVMIASLCCTGEASLTVENRTAGTAWVWVGGRLAGAVAPASSTVIEPPAPAPGEAAVDAALVVVAAAADGGLRAQACPYLTQNAPTRVVFGGGDVLAGAAASAPAAKAEPPAAAVALADALAAERERAGEFKAVRPALPSAKHAGGEDGAARKPTAARAELLVSRPGGRVLYS